MTAKPLKLCLTLLCVGTLSPSFLCAVGSSKHVFDEIIIEGQTYHLNKRKASTVDLAKHMKKSARVLPPCPPPPPPSVVGVVPGQVGTPATFFPNNSLTDNLLIAPPQTLGITPFVVHSQAINPFIIGTPPGPMGSVGPTQYLVTSDQRLASFDKQGNFDGILNIDTLSFPNADGDLSYLQDFDWVHSRYDKFSDSFIYIRELYNDIGDHNNQGFTIAVSDSGTITNATQWTVIDIYNQSVVPDITGCSGDQSLAFTLVQFGVDQHAIYIGQGEMIYNFSDPNPAAFAASTAFVVQKESIFNDGPVVVTAFRDLQGFPGDEFPNRVNSGSLTGVDNFDANPEFGYFVATDALNFGRLQFFRVINPGSTSPTISAEIPVDVLTTSTALATPIPWAGNLWGSITVLSNDFTDDQLPHAHIRNKQLYTIHTMAFDSNGLADATGDRVGARWYQFDMTGDANGTGANVETETTVPALVQAGTLWDPTPNDPLNYYINAIMTNARGDLVISGTISNNTTTPSAYVVGRLATDTKGLLRVGVNRKGLLYAVGSGAFLATPNSAPNGGQRWGPYSNVSLDPEDEMTMWTIQEILQNGLETMVVAQLLAP